jgi:hypothetical protein
MAVTTRGRLLLTVCLRFEPSTLARRAEEVYLDLAMQNIAPGYVKTSHLAM